MKRERSRRAIDSYLQGNSSEKEQAQIETWYLLQVEDADHDMPAIDYQATGKRIWDKMEGTLQNKDIKETKPYRLNKLVSWKWVGVAASLLIAFAAAYFYAQKLKPHNDRFTVSREKDIAPGTNKAFLTLSNGKRIDLTASVNGLVASESGLEITKQRDGEIVYKLKAMEGNNGFNTIETPIGGQYTVVLPDGSKVWLNSASKLKYPIAFEQDKRKVDLSGEGYFEVARVMNKKGNTRLPFVVSSIDRNGITQEVSVLGTHFNINNYPDEPILKTTLLEGSVAVAVGGGNKVVLKPGQQSSLTGTKLAVSQAETEMAVAWKNGEFVWHEDLRSAMRKIARWYDIEVVYDDSAPDELMLGGWMSREKNISDVLNHIQSTGKVHFKLEGRRVTVLK